MINVSIIVPIYIANPNLFLMTKACIESLKFNTYGVNPELIIVDDASPEPRLVDILQNKFFPDITWIRNVKNRGFAHSINCGIAASTNELILLLNNDVKITNSDWLIKMVESLNINHFDATSPAMGLLDSNYQYITIDRRDQHTGKTFSYLDGWALLARKKLFEQIGLLPICMTHSFFEDTLFSWILQNKKFKFGVSSNIGIEHLGRTSFRASGHDINNLYNINRQKFIDIVEGRTICKLPTLVEYKEILKGNK